jgi:outer membrane protein OmpA-like peptidoglycan-associated protein
MPVPRLLVCMLASVSLISAGCATKGPIPVSRPVCMVAGAAVGIATALIVRHNQDSDPDTDDNIGAGAIGAGSGALVGALLCGTPADKQLPTVRASAEPNSGDAPLDVTLRGVANDPDGEVTSFAWDLGDGSTAQGNEVQHTYRQPGEYTATLTVTDDDSQTSSATARVRVTARAPAAPAVTEKIVLRGVNFDFDSARIRPDAQVVLDAAAEILNESPNSAVRVAGHTDSTGPEVYNQGLSERRAASVVDYLVGQGIARSRLSAVGLGESQPVATNDTRDGRAQNRRVALEVQ